MSRREFPWEPIGYVLGTFFVLLVFLGYCSAVQECEDKGMVGVRDAIGLVVCVPGAAR